MAASTLGNSEVVAEQKGRMLKLDDKSRKDKRANMDLDSISFSNVLLLVHVLGRIEWVL